MVHTGATVLTNDPRLLALNTIACSVPPGAGGAGRHFQELIELAEAIGVPSLRYVCPTPPPGLGRDHVRVPNLIRGGRLITRIPALRAYGWYILGAGVLFDLSASRTVRRNQLGYTGFASQALSSLRAARRRGVTHLALAAANSHVDNVWRQQALARRLYPIDRGWLTEHLRRRTRAEYELADVILVTSTYQAATFIEFGVDPRKLVRTDLSVDPRFRVRDHPPTSSTFNIAYIGRFDLIKGIPVLLDAFEKVASPDWRLTLMGQFSSYGLRRYVERRVAGDPRVSLVQYGDPGPLLLQTHVFVHPTFEDGFGYAPMEALSMGVPVIVTDQTGMSEHVSESVNGSIFPAGDVEALADRLYQYASNS